MLTANDINIQKFVELLIQPGDTVIDVGVNHMQNTKKFISLVQEQGLVIGFEPSVNLWRKTFTQYEPCDNWICFNHALGSYNGKVFFREYVDPYSGCSSLMSLTGHRPKDIGYTDHYVEIKTLDSVLANSSLPWHRTTVLKIDTEGSEFDILLGASNLIKTCRPTLILEISHYANEIYQLLEPQGYSMFSLQQGQPVACHEVFSFGNFDIVCLHDNSLQLTKSKLDILKV